MIGIFTFDAPLFCDINGVYCNTTVTNEMLERFFTVVDKIYLLMRTDHINETYDERHLVRLELGNRIEVVEMPNPNTPKNFLCNGYAKSTITGIDTRALTKLLRERGVMMGRIEIEGVESAPSGLDYGQINYVETVSCRDIIRYNEGARKRVVLVDCGVKTNIIRCLLKRGIEIIRVPWNYDFNELEYDGLFISNGPGNPENCQKTVDNIRRAMLNDKPIFGICMGNQLLAKASGAAIYKLKYGHRSHNQPVRLVGSERCFVTSQNHGYAVDSTTLSEEWLPLFENMNDGSNEGIRHRSKPWFSVQFHPEASAGPTDTEFLFDEFIKLL